MRRRVLLAVILAGLLLATSCVVPLSRTVVNPNFHVTGDKVIRESAGLYLGISIPTFSVGWIAVEDPETLPVMMFELARANGCTKLENIDIDYWVTHYFIVGLPKVKVTATCVK